MGAFFRGFDCGRFQGFTFFCGSQQTGFGGDAFLRLGAQGFFSLPALGSRLGESALGLGALLCGYCGFSFNLRFAFDCRLDIGFFHCVLRR